MISEQTDWFKCKVCGDEDAALLIEKCRVCEEEVCSKIYDKYRKAINFIESISPAWLPPDVRKRRHEVLKLTDVT